MLSIKTRLDKNTEKRRNYQNAKYLRRINTQQRNPLMQERTNEKCPLCKSKRNFYSLNSLYRHFLTVHRITQRIFESKDEFKIRQEKEFDYKDYVLALAKKLFRGEI